MKNTLRVERAIKNISQEELAAAVGVARQTINYIEANKFIPSVLVCIRIAEYFDKPLQEIFFLDEVDRIKINTPG